VNSPFIVFEGMDGAGKSVISSLVAKKLKAIHLESPIGQFKALREYVDEYLPNSGRFHFYMASNFDLSNKIREYKTNNTCVICTRYIYSSIIGYASRQNIDIETLYKRSMAEKDELEKPDLTFFLYVDKAQQRLRIKSRSDIENSKSDFMSLNDESYQRRLSMNYKYISEKENWLHIDTTSKDISEVVDLCIEAISNL
tara:strand:- start:320 stop:913 length:594 start_codon:yes stop_codon:yes gene_type:complete